MMSYPFWKPDVPQEDTGAKPCVMEGLLVRIVYLTVFGFSSCICASTVRTDTQLNSQEAYVTLLYGDVYMLGVRVLGQSLRNSKTDRDCIVLCTEDVTESTKKVLQNDGWIIKSVQSLPNPYKGFSPRFVKVLTKLLIWTLTEYRKVVFIDSDALVLRNIDHMFRCGNFCASLRHSDLFNTGVIVLEPSQKIFNDMKSKLGSGCLESYDEGDQGFLNSYFPELKYSVMFNASEKVPGEGYMRLPAGYNADIGVYYMLSYWLIPPEELMIFHYTLGPMKPWKWWSYPMFELNWEWQQLRSMLSPHYREPTLCNVVNWLPVILLICLYFSSRYWLPYYEKMERHLTVPFSAFIDPVHGSLTSYFNIFVMCLSSYIAFRIVPLAMSPIDGWIVCGVWFFSFLIVFYFPYCHLVYIVGQRHGQQKVEHYFTARIETLIWILVAIFLYILGLSSLWVISSFSFRVKFLFIFTVIVLLFSHFAGDRVTKVWFGFRSMSSGEIGPVNSHV